VDLFPSGTEINYGAGGLKLKQEEPVITLIIGLFIGVLVGFIFAAIIAGGNNAEQYDSSSHPPTKLNDP
jgi:hypothetical protein